MRWLEPGVVVTYELLFWSKMNAASVVVTCEIEPCALRGDGGCKNFSIIASAISSTITITSSISNTSAISISSASTISSD